ncbi:MAG: glycine cleavage system protein GcvH [Candidatus Ratteibacteria bacterium]|jgi:glycine cleavage system H protein
MNVPKELRYTKEHEWIRIEGGKGTVGITEYAQESLGDITFVELPSLGFEVEGKKKLASIESVKAASDIYAPVSGKVVEINAEIESSPELVNQSPYEKGWVVRIEIRDLSEEQDLLTPEAYEEYLKTL